MKTVTNIDSFIESLRDMDSYKGDWEVYPKIGGLEADCFFTPEGVKINDTLYPLNTKIITEGYEPTLIAPNMSCKLVNSDNLLTINIETKKKFNEAPLDLLNECYFFSIEKNNIPRVPHYYRFANIYSLLDNLNLIDRNLRITDWYVIGLVVKKGSETLLYIKPPLEAITKVNDIAYVVGRSGAVMPVIKFEPVNFNGTLTLQTNVLDDKFISKNKIEIGDIVTIKMKRQGHQNTEVKSVIYPFSKKNKVPTLTNCPSCNSVLVKKKNSNFLLCYNDYCQEKLIKKVIHWCSRECMDIKGLGLKYVEYMVKHKIVINVDDIYVLTRDDLCSVPGILDKMADNILKEIKDSRTNSIINVIVGLGIDNIGRNASSLIAWHCSHLHELLNINSKNINQLSMILGKEQRHSLVDFISKEVNREVILNLSRHLNPKPIEIKMSNHPYHKKTFTLKGDFYKYRREEIKTILIRAGIRITNSDNTFDYCLYGLNQNKKLLGKIPKSKTIKLTKLLQTLLY